MIHVYDVRAVYAQEVGRQTFLHAFHGEEHDDGAWLIDDVYLQIFGHALNVAYVGNLHAHHFVLRLQEYVLVGEFWLWLGWQRERCVGVLVAFLYT